MAFRDLWQTSRFLLKCKLIALHISVSTFSLVLVIAITSSPFYGIVQ